MGNPIDLRKLEEAGTDLQLHSHIVRGIVKLTRNVRVQCKEDEWKQLRPNEGHCASENRHDEFETYLWRLIVNHNSKGYQAMDERLSSPCSADNDPRHRLRCGRCPFPEGLSCLLIPSARFPHGRWRRLHHPFSRAFSMVAKLLAVFQDLIGKIAKENRSKSSMSELIEEHLLQTTLKVRNNLFCRTRPRLKTGNCTAGVSHLIAPSNKSMHVILQSRHASFIPSVYFTQRNEGESEGYTHTPSPQHRHRKQEVAPRRLNNTRQ